MRIIFVPITLCFFINFAFTERTFTINYENNTFLKDGNPFHYVSGSIHYFRVPWQLWEDRLYKMKMAGLNAIQTYVEWSHHEPEPGEYNFDGNYDLVKFLQTAQKLDLLVILRAGPFIDAERDMGGLPYWLLRINPNMKIRTYDKSYIKYVDRWFSVLLRIIRPLLYQNGGPIILVQIENEYGSLAECDAQYTSYLRDLFKSHLKDEVVLFTTDGSSSHAVTCGKVDQVLSTIDFGTGSNVTDLFNMLRWHQSFGPLVNSEFYSGWLDHWGEPHAEVSAKNVSNTLNDILSANASVNIYMFHGGTSFGFSAGANLGSTYQACPTSYDYDAPLSEAGDPTPKYYSIRSVIGKFFPLPPGPVPEPSPKMQLGPVLMNKVTTLWSVLPVMDEIKAKYPQPFEDLKQAYGFVLYETTVSFMTTDPALLTVPHIADRGYIYINKVFRGILSREYNIFSIPIQVQKNEVISILVENQGRVCFGSGIKDRKGIFNNVTLGSQILTNWTMKVVQFKSEIMEKLERAEWNNTIETDNDQTPAFYMGKFTVPKNALYDTFLRLDGWHRGIAFINGFNLGRYWPIVGPQVTLYVPSVLLKEEPQLNVITVLELEHSPCNNVMSCYIHFVKMHVVNGTTPKIF